MQINSGALSGLETKFIALDRKGASGAEIGGYASHFGVADQNGDVVEAGAFAASLKRLARENRTVKLLWQHDPSAPIGVWDSVTEDRVGLSVRGRLLTEIARGAEAAALLAAGAVDGLSIGYRTVRAERAGAGRRLIELDLWEVSLVTFPMLPSARASTQAPNPEADIARELAEALRGARETLM
ncbi:HK97 family phage prohead protease [Pikeienuella piscinae]|uniref:HK97 family phage prohead protease n=1 Tax=Pikeienuella piscinae TaxID=2748098 RepID=A0A7L5BT88_9RHOB|nr:HK97 family phage prohead protease [Pikeienuella piscinae]